VSAAQGQDGGMGDREPPISGSTATGRLVTWADQVQRKHRVLAFPYAVVKKFGDDDGGRQAALLTYYAFLSLFPLLLVGVSVLSHVLVGHPTLRTKLINAIVPAELRPTVEHAVTTMPAAGLPFLIGLLGALFAGTGVVFSAYETLNHLVGVPRRSRFGFLPRYLRVFSMLIVVLVGGVGSAALTVVSATLPRVNGLQQLAAAFGTAVVMFVVLALSIKLLVARPTAFRACWPAAAAGAVIVAGLLAVGTRVLALLVTNAGPVYGSFASVVGAFSLLYLASEALLYSAEATIVYRRRLWPRGLDLMRLTLADTTVITGLAIEQERLPQERIEVRYEESSLRRVKSRRHP
jgi:membrane protein